MTWYREIRFAMESGTFNATIRRIVEEEMEGELPVMWSDLAAAASITP